MSQPILSALSYLLLRPGDGDNASGRGEGANREGGGVLQPAGCDGQVPRRGSPHLPLRADPQAGQCQGGRVQHQHGHLPEACAGAGACAS